MQKTTTLLSYYYIIPNIECSTKSLFKYHSILNTDLKKDTE